MGKTIQERLTEFYERLQCAPAAQNAESAFELLCRVLDEVEDELSGIAKAAAPPWPADFDGRMYPPQPDFVVRHEDGRITARTRGHLIEISASGAIKIVNKLTGETEMSK